MLLNLKEEFIQSIDNRYQEKGRLWIENLESQLQKYKQQFKLFQIQQAEELSMNIIVYAQSQIYGAVVLKIGSPGKTSIRGNKLYA